MASLAATVWPKPVAIVPCLSWTTASTVFTRGVMSQGIPWKLLQEQFYGNSAYRDIMERLKENEKNGNFNYFIPSTLIYNFNEKKGIDQLIIDFMRLLMDECTHMVNYEKPFDTSLARIIAAKDDAYVLRDGVDCFSKVWPDCKIDFLDQGHVSAFILSQAKYRQTIRLMTDLLIDKYF